MKTDWERPNRRPLRLNKTGTSQVGAISQAQKYSMNNYWGLLEKTFFKKKYFCKKKFQKSIFFKSRTMPKNSKEAIQAHSTFLKTENFKKMQGSTL